MASFIVRISAIAIALFFSILPVTSQALTVDEAITLARENVPFYRAAGYRVKSSEELYKATLGPYLPALDASTQQQRHMTTAQEFNTWLYDITASYTLFDGGRRRANRDISRLTLDSDREVLRTNLLDLEFNVKNAFYTVIAQKETLDQRKKQLQDTQKDYEVAEGRYKFGVAKLSDLLQASVRLEQARFNVVQAEGNLNKAFSDLNSLLGKSLEERYDLQGSLDIEFVPPGREALFMVAMERPEIKQAENSLKISEKTTLLNLSTFFPVLSVNATYQSTSGGLAGLATGGGVINEEWILGFNATWNIFELGKFYQYRSSVIEQSVSTELLSDIKRTVKLNVDRAYEDFTTSVNQLKVAQQQLTQAQQNYEQAYGEYKVGKGDILSLVQAESQLSTAREQLVASRLSVILFKSQLERVVGVTTIGSVPR
ncbi:MAG: TolC family protein [Chloroflexota bacterium]